MASKLIMIALMCCVLYAAVNGEDKKCKKQEICKCVKIMDPVCGRDGKWYNNECLMECAGVKWDYDHCCLGERPGFKLF